MLKNIANGITRFLNKNVLKNNIFFMHIPKCGGTSVEEAIQKSSGFRSGLKASARGLTAYPECNHLNAHASRRASTTLGVNLHSHREQILLYFMSQKPPPMLISGHYKFSESAYEKYGDKFNFVTTVRDPVERWISQYFYNRYKKGKHFSTNKRIKSYIKTDEAKLSGKMMTSYFSGVKRENIEYEKSDLKKAKKNIKKFEIVGDIENIKEFESAYAKKFGASIDVPNNNKNPKIEKEISEDTMSKIESLCRYDIEIYKYIKNNR